MTSQPEIWPWLLDTFGMPGTLLVLFLVLLLCLVWVVLPFGVWRLFRHYRALAQQLDHLREQTAHLSRQQQVARLERDKPRRRRRRR